MIANGGGAVALLAFLETAFTTPELAALRPFVVFALLLFHIGIVSAMVHNRLRRRCSLAYEHAGYTPDPIPTVCKLSDFFRQSSVFLFLAGGLVLFAGGSYVLMQT